MSPKLPLHPLRLLPSISSASPIKAQLFLSVLGTRCLGLAGQSRPPTKWPTPMPSARTSPWERVWTSMCVYVYRFFMEVSLAQLEAVRQICCRLELPTFWRFLELRLPIFFCCRENGERRWSEPKMIFPNVLLCPQPKDIRFTFCHRRTRKAENIHI